MAIRASATVRVTNIQGVTSLQPLNAEGQPFAKIDVGKSGKLAKGGHPRRRAPGIGMLTVGSKGALWTLLQQSEQLTFVDLRALPARIIGSKLSTSRRMRCAESRQRAISWSSK